jgi:hypothetical protein
MRALPCTGCKHAAIAGIVSTLALTTPAAKSAAQQPDTAQCSAALPAAHLAGPAGDIARLTDLLVEQSASSYLIRRSSDRVVVAACAAPAAVERMAQRLSLIDVPQYGFATLPADFTLVNHSDYPRDWNDGVTWGGVGTSLTLGTGVAGRWGPLEAALAPLLVLEQNESYEYQRWPDSDRSPQAHRWRAHFLDMPQQPAQGARTFLDPGHSYLRVAARGFRAGISTETIVWGPARRNPLLLSGTAGGFPHAFVETAGGRATPLGAAEAQLFIGRLSESDDFDFDPDNDRRALNGALVTLRPRRLDGLYIGAGYLHMQTWRDGTSARDLILGPWSGIDHDSIGYPRDLRLLSLFMRWAGAPGGMEVYGEWARQDRLRDWFRLLNPVEQSNAYSIGLQKIVRRGETAVRVQAEVSHLADALPNSDFGRGISTFYVSPYVIQGHTHRGQLLGAPIGPGSESQFLGVDVFWRAGRTGLSVERVRYDDDAYYSLWYPIHGPHGHDTEMSFRAAHMISLATLSLDAELGYSFRYSRSFLGLLHGNYPDFPYRRETNLGIRLTGSWRPPGYTWSR